jgi:hypothetical protein
MGYAEFNSEQEGFFHSSLHAMSVRPTCYLGLPARTYGVLSPPFKILYSDVLMAVHIQTIICYTSSCEIVMPLSQENAADLHSLGKNPLTLATMEEVKHILSKTRVSFTERCGYFFIYNKPKVKFMHRSYHTEHNTQ